jgi:hypothetical protein
VQLRDSVHSERAFTGIANANNCLQPAKKHRVNCKALCVSVTVLAWLLFAPVSRAQSWDDKLRWTIDFSSRLQYLTNTSGSNPGQFNSVGVDAFRVFSSRYRDVATVNLQINLWCINNLERRPGFFDGPDDCQLVTKASFVNFAIRGDGKFNLLVGHPELPFGLEVPVSTNQTLRQLTNPRDLGLKLDWGVGANGTIGGYHYATTVGRGSGVKYKDSNNPYSITARIGKATDTQSYLGAPGFGVSGFYGDVLTRVGSISNRWRLGLDGIFYRGGFGFMGQLSVGKTDSMDTINGLAEVNAVTRSANSVGYFQLRSFNQDFSTGWQDAWSAVAGMRFTPDTHWALSFQLEHELSVFGARTEQTIIDLQLRYRK